MGTVIRFSFGVILGALVGATVGCMLAPQAGEETRSQVQQRMRDVVEEGRRAAAERRAEMEAQFAEAKRAPRA